MSFETTKRMQPGRVYLTYPLRPKRFIILLNYQFSRGKEQHLFNREQASRTGDILCRKMLFRLKCNLALFPYFSRMSYLECRTAEALSLHPKHHARQLGLQLDTATVMGV